MTIGYRATFTPTFVLTPADCTDTVVSLESKDTGVVTVKDGVSLYGQGRGSTEVTAKTSGGLEFTFSVTVDSQTGIEITKLPDKTEYNVGEKKDLTGLVVSLVFSNGDREQTFGYDVTGFSTAAIGDKTVTVKRDKYTAEFTISVVRMLTGTLGSSDELTWTYSTKSGQLTLTGPVSEQEPVFAAVYDEKGRMLRVFTVTASGGQADVGGDFDRVKLIWVDAKQIPKCVNKEINGADIR